jgi:predicted small secreted protein
MKKIAYLITIILGSMIVFGCGNTVSTETKDVTPDTIIKETIVADTVVPVVKDTIKVLIHEKK